MSKITQREEYLTVVVIGLVALLAMNYIGDFTYRGANNSIIDTNNQNWITQVQINNDLLDASRSQTQINEMNDKDIDSNTRAIDKLIGILLRGEF